MLEVFNKRVKFRMGNSFSLPGKFFKAPATNHLIAMRPVI